jgi:hypothetical protein
MNLGQLIGQLRLRIDTLEEQVARCVCGASHEDEPAHIALRQVAEGAPEKPAAETLPIPPCRRKVDAKGRILRVLQTAEGPLRMGEIRKRADNLWETNASVAMLKLIDEGRITRKGKPGFYEYELVREE